MGYVQMIGMVSKRRYATWGFGIRLHGINSIRGLKAIRGLKPPAKFILSLRDNFMLSDKIGQAHIQAA